MKHRDVKQFAQDPPAIKLQNKSFTLGSPLQDVCYFLVGSGKPPSARLHSGLCTLWRMWASQNSGPWVCAAQVGQSRSRVQFGKGRLLSGVEEGIGSSVVMKMLFLTQQMC